MSNSVSYTKSVVLGKFPDKALPVILPIERGLCLQFDDRTEQDVHLQLQTCAFQLIEAIGIGNLKITIIDIGIRANFPDLSKLHQANNRVTVIRESKDAIRVIQNLVVHARDIDQWLGTEFQTLFEYNAKTKKKEPYHLLLVANFLDQFESELPRLKVLLSQMQRTGLLFMGSMDISYMAACDAKFRNAILDTFKQMPLGFPFPKKYNFQNIPEVIIKTIDGLGFEWNLIDREKVATTISQLNKKLIALDNPEGKTDFLKIQIGSQGRKPYHLTMGEQSGIMHGFISGATNTGKSSLLNTIIVKIAEQYSPDELQLYLLDYKEGVEFFIYENHPNVRVLLLDNQNRDFARQKLEEFAQEIKRRSLAFIELSRKTGKVINSIGRYNQFSDQKMPRLLLIIDEFRQLFQGVSYNAASHLDILIRRVAEQGRAYGLHLLFCSQSFSIENFSSATKQQFQLRISFKLADVNACAGIMSLDNASPLSLNKYEIIYNTDFGNGKQADNNQRVKTELFFEPDDIPILLAEARAKFPDTEISKEVCRADMVDEPSENNQVNERQAAPKNGKLADNKAFLDELLKD